MRGSHDGAGLRPFPLVVDRRGSLLPVELDEVPFTVRRIFLVTGAVGGVDRGDHVIPCQQEVVLVAGRAQFRVTTGTHDDVTTLDRPGERVSLPAGSYVHYHLADERSQVLVLAEEPYRP